MVTSVIESDIGEVVLGRYRIDRPLGSGGFANVYHARGRSGEEVAVKICRATERTAVLRFAREIEVLRALPPNPSVVGYFDHGTMPDGRPLIVLEYVDGFTLQEGIKRRPKLDPREAVVLLAMVCRAFTGLHELGVAHRDVKPGNILLTRAGDVKLVDFGLIRDAQGILKLLEDQEGASIERRLFSEDIDSGMLAGTIEYMAPEQILDSVVKDVAAAQTDTASDVFSLGVICLELLAGARPFGRAPSGAPRTAREVNAFVRWRLRQTDVELSSLPDVDPALLSILRRALCHDPRLRQPECRTLMTDLRSYLETGRGVEIDSSRTLHVSVGAVAAETPTRIVRSGRRGAGGDAGPPETSSNPRRADLCFPDAWGIETIDEGAMTMLASSPLAELDERRAEPGAPLRRRRGHEETALLDATALHEIDEDPTHDSGKAPLPRATKGGAEAADGDETTRWRPLTTKRRR